MTHEHQTPPRCPPCTGNCNQGRACTSYTTGVTVTPAAPAPQASATTDMEAALTTAFNHGVQIGVCLATTVGCLVSGTVMYFLVSRS